jgi:hypothetical protein
MSHRKGKNKKAVTSESKADNATQRLQEHFKKTFGIDIPEGHETGGLGLMFAQSKEELKDQLATKFGIDSKREIPVCMSPYCSQSSSNHRYVLPDVKPHDPIFSKNVADILRHAASTWLKWPLSEHEDCVTSSQMFALSNPDVRHDIMTRNLMDVLSDEEVMALYVQTYPLPSAVNGIMKVPSSDWVPFAIRALTKSIWNECAKMSSADKDSQSNSLRPHYAMPDVPAFHCDEKYVRFLQDSQRMREAMTKWLPSPTVRMQETFVQLMYKIPDATGQSTKERDE